MSYLQAKKYPRGIRGISLSGSFKVKRYGSSNHRLWSAMGGRMINGYMSGWVGGHSVFVATVKYMQPGGGRQAQWWIFGGYVVVNKVDPP